MVETFHVVLDFEMNPVRHDRNRNEGYRGKLQSEIIEIGAVKLNDDVYEPVDEFSILVKPQMNDRIESKITSLTGITFEDVENAVCYEDAVTAFADWIGYREPVRLYSWSTSDSAQICHECEEKNIPVPENMKDWIDFQKMFPRETGLHLERQLSLEFAAELAGIDFDEKSAHRALYDAKITADLVSIVLSGEYRERMKNVTNVLRSSIETSTASMAEKLGPKYAELMARFAEKKS